MCITQSVQSCEGKRHFTQMNRLVRTPSNVSVVSNVNVSIMCI